MRRTYPALLFGMPGVDDGGWMIQPRLYGEFIGLATAAGAKNVTWVPLVPDKKKIQHLMNPTHGPLTNHTPPPHTACLRVLQLSGGQAPGRKRR